MRSFVLLEIIPLLFYTGGNLGSPVPLEVRHATPLRSAPAPSPPLSSPFPLYVPVSLRGENRARGSLLLYLSKVRRAHHPPACRHPPPGVQSHPAVTPATIDGGVFMDAIEKVLTKAPSLNILFVAWHSIAQPMLYNDRRLKQRRQNLRNSATEPEQRLWFALRKRNLGGYKFQRQYGIGPYIVDFYCPARRLAVEVDGGQHFESAQQAYDNKRTLFLISHDIRVVRVTNVEVMNDFDNVLEKILEVANTPLAPLVAPLTGKRGGICNNKSGVM